MIDCMRINQATTAEWSDLVDELDRWAAAGRVATLWWRDDDAVTATPQLDALLRLAGDVPLALAVVPAFAQPELAAVLDGLPFVAVMQHGWQHANRAGQGKKSEYPEGRSTAAVASEIGTGQARLKALFGQRFVNVLAPPWNRFGEEFLPLLPANGIGAISRMASPKRGALPPGLVAIDVHVDFVGWRGDRGFIGTAVALGGLIGHLRANRVAAPAAVPTGILTHHLVMDGPTAAFIDRLIQLTDTHSAVRWATVAELLQ